jgi:2-amino-4-hydroxy-6-hydroxymethyldihydropteridine diphosphokinase
MEFLSPTTVRAFIGLGSNLGNREERILGALDWLAKHSQIDLRNRTKIVETAPWGLLGQPSFLNAVAEIRTDLSPLELLGELKRAEKELGRAEEIVKWGPREIDLDILLYGEKVVDSKDLIIPHPHLLERPFVITHLLELDPDLVHPVKKAPLATCMPRQNTYF